MRVAVIVFPGSNCDRDMHHVLTDVFKLESQLVWHTDELPKNIDAIVLPGGFSYGDRLRAGVIAAHSPVIAQVKKMAEKGMPILGVCNGFQILTEAGLLPGALLKNTSLSYICRWTEIIVKNNKTPFTNKFKLNQRIPIAIANGEGRYYADKETLRLLKKNNQIVFSYAEDVNGSTMKIASICNKEGNVVGMMPHPERSAEQILNPKDAKPASMIFESLLNTLGVTA
ncbi:MAG TPA: phosphoribosylformylglycinamidine synthase subunit PurQ [Candidatus Nitrosotalea sp.]|nr:phosphoribosylformylglycinamidine synthase subunit PurQ [Candidatus Nitrosotalea sp.]